MHTIIHDNSIPIFSTLSNKISNWAEIFSFIVDLYKENDFER